MGRYGADVKFMGSSGNAYDFELWEINSRWTEVPAVFIASKKEYDHGQTRFLMLGCAETSNLREYLSNERILEQLKASGAKLICVLREGNRRTRQMIQADIRKYYSQRRHPQ